MLPVVTPGGLVDADETIRAGTSAEQLASLAPAFRTPELAERFPDVDWRITAGNSSPLTDAASAALIMSEERANALGLTPRARFHAFAVVGDDPAMLWVAERNPRAIRLYVRNGFARDGARREDEDRPLLSSVRMVR